MELKLTLAIFLIFFSFSVVNAEKWAVVIAGSNGYWNYRHHADACHAITLLKERGVKQENIVAMYYDDVASDPSNPFPGKLYNKPTDDINKAVDVYADCHNDYSGDAVTPDNFLAVITGDKASIKGGNGKVLQSTDADEVFIYFVDHGGVGLIGFPNGAILSSDDLNQALTTMTQKNMYRQLTFYLEACESGSMFNNGQLPSNTRIYATTAANGEESSFGTYCSPDDYVGNTHLGTCLGDEYSVNWLENTDSFRSLFFESLEKQYTKVKEATQLSHVCQFGDLDFTKEPVAAFLGRKTVHSTSKGVRGSSSKVSSRNVKLHTLYTRYVNAQTDEEIQAALFDLSNEISTMRYVDNFFKSLVDNLHLGGDMFEVRGVHFNTGCMSVLNHMLEDECNIWSDYSLKYASVVANMCDVDVDIQKVQDLLKSMCGSILHRV